MDWATQPEAGLFQAALQLAPSARAAFLDLACQGNADLRERLASRLAAHDRGEHPPGQPAAGCEPAPTVKVDFLDVQDYAVGTSIGRYKLLEKIGEGGCGIVYVAEQTVPVRRRLALKVIKLGMDTRAVVARFEAERQALAMMDHPNIAKVLDAGSTETGRPYFVMELVRGIRITDYCDQNHLPTKDRLDLFMRVCQAIQHAHQKGIIHRDIKPSNILVTLHDGVPVPKVIDFGIAKATEGRLTDATVYTQLNQFIGTPAYMSPEQAEMSGLDVDTRSDIYSLGVLLYELLTGRTPFDAQELMSQGLDAMRKTIREQEPVRPSTKLATLKGDDLTTTAKRRSVETSKLASLLKGDLDWIVMKCLEKDRTRRYETANGLALDVGRHLNCQPVLARPPSKLYEFQKTARRHKVGFAAAAAVVAALAVGVTLTTWQAVRATRAKRDAEAARLEAETHRAEADTARKAETEQRLRTEQARANEAAQRAVAETNAAKARESDTQSRRLLYAADMNLAQQAVQLNNLGRARRLLERHRPAAGEEDLRGWEWRYLWQQCRSDALAVLAKRPARGFSVSFSPDGSRLAAGYFDGRIELWDVSRRVLVQVLSTGGPPAHVAFSPRTNLLAVTGQRGAIKLHDLSSGSERILWQSPFRSIRELSFAPGGDRLLAFTYGAGEPAAVMFDMQKGVALSTNASSGATIHMGIARLSADLGRLYLSYADFESRQLTVKCLNPESRQELWQADIGLDYGVTAMALSPDGKFLVVGTGYEDSSIRVLDANTGKLLTKLGGHTGWIGELVFSHDGRWLASAAADQSIRLWDAASWVEATVFRGHGEEVHTVAFSPNDKTLASGGKDGAIMLWDVTARQSNRGYSLMPEVTFATEVAPGVALAANSQMWPPRILRLNDLSQSAVQVPTWFHTNDAFTYLPPNLFGIYDETNTVWVCEIQSETPKLVAGLAVGTNIVRDPRSAEVALAYCAARRLVAWGDASGTAQVVKLDQPAQRVPVNSRLNEPAPVAFSRDGKFLALCSSRGRGLEVREVATRKLVLDSDVRVRLDRGSLLFANGGQELVALTAGGSNREILFWDLTQPDKQPVSFQEPGTLSEITASPDGRWVATCSQDSFVVLYDSQTVERKQVLHGHMQGAHAVRFSPDGKTLASSSGSREAIKLWRVDTGQELLTLAGRGALLPEVQFVDGGNALLAGSPGQTGTWQLWRAPSLEEIAATEARETTVTQVP
jgi:WD40 repeat protein/serine/threonine protein kinase